jgi:hypothetical protein
MARKKTHPQVEFAVDVRDYNQRLFKTFDEAAGFAVALAASDGRPRNIDVLIYNARGAAWYGGDDAVEAYEEDPDASIFERIEIRADAIGRIP